MSKEAGLSFLEKNLQNVRQSPTTSPAKKKQPKFQLNDKSDMGESKTPPIPGTQIISSNKKHDTTNTPSNTDKLHTHIGGVTIEPKGGAVETTREETQASTEASGVCRLPPTRHTQWSQSTEQRDSRTDRRML